MKETTRQLILLFGVLTLLTSSYVAITSLGNGGDQTVKEPERPEPPEPNNSGTNLSNQSEPETIIGKSIRGYQIMMRDIKAAMGITSGKIVKSP